MPSSENEAKLLAFLASEIGNKEHEVATLKASQKSGASQLVAAVAKLDALMALRSAYKQPKRPSWRKKRAARLLQNAVASSGVAKVDTPDVSTAPETPMAATSVRLDIAPDTLAPTPVESTRPPPAETPATTQSVRSDEGDTPAAIIQPIVATPGPPRQLAERPADKEQIAHWAAPRGIVFSDWPDLPKVNEQRVKNGDPPFCRRNHHSRA